MRRASFTLSNCFASSRYACTRRAFWRCTYCAFVTGSGLLPHPAARSASTTVRRTAARPTALGTLPATLRETPSWGIEPVPERLHVLGTFDTTLLWTNLG